ncbi:MAG: hypothetical protein IPO80_08915 [Propionibacteriaceae bacterium]|nr:hypothetical protein [Propionibacteriaceae bacterium]
MQPLMEQVRDVGDARSLWMTVQETTKMSWTDGNRATFDRQRAVPLSRELAALKCDLESSCRSFESILARLYDTPS